MCLAATQTVPEHVLTSRSAHSSVGAPVCCFPDHRRHRNCSQRSRLALYPLGLEAERAPEGRLVTSCSHAWSQVTRTSLTLHQRSPLVRLGLHPGFAVVIYFWHLSLASSSSRARRRSSKISCSGHECLLRTHFSPLLSPLPKGLWDLCDSCQVHSRTCKDLTVSSWCSDGQKPGGRQGAGEAVGQRR